MALRPNSGYGFFIFGVSRSHTTTRNNWYDSSGQVAARRKDRYLTTHNTYHRQTLMPSVGFETAIPASERPQTYALDRAATGTGEYLYIMEINFCRSQWSCLLRRRSAAARLLRLWVRIPPGAWMPVCCKCCVLSGRGHCDALITRPEESYRL